MRDEPAPTKKMREMIPVAGPRKSNKDGWKRWLDMR